MATNPGDNAFTGDLYGSAPELVFAGATSFARRKFTRDLEGVDVVVSGIPWDGATTYRPGARFGPRAIRQASANLCFGKVWPWNLDPFDTLAVIDWGDVMFPEGNWPTMSELLQRHADLIVQDGKKMLTLGGDHYVTLPILRAHARVHGPIALVHFDAHSDTWDDDHEHHGTMFLTAINEGLIDVAHSVHVGVRTFNDHDWGMAILTAPWVHDHGTTQVAEFVRTRVGARPAYLTFDIDCLDPSCAPGTGTPVVGGLTTAQAQAILYQLGGIDFVGMDVVEVSPPYDHAEITALAGATLALDWLCLLAANETPNPYQGGATPSP